MPPALSPMSLPGPPESPTNPVSPTAQVPTMPVYGGPCTPTTPRGPHAGVRGEQLQSLRSRGAPRAGTGPTGTHLRSGTSGQTSPRPGDSPATAEPPVPPAPSISHAPKPTRARPDAPSPCTGGRAAPPDRARWPWLFLSRLVAEPPSPAIQGGVICPRVPHFRSPKRAARRGWGELSPQRSNLLVLHARPDAGDVSLTSWGHFVMFVCPPLAPVSQFTPN